ncbi:MAG: YwiC-like family protein [Anaerolineales bacterium]|jgi:hypothetical protein
MTTFSQTYLRRHLALPTDHGSWVFILSPLLIGLFASSNWSIASVHLVVAALAAFLIRQPVTVVVKAYSGRRSKRDLPAARLWILVYSIIGALAVAGLMLKGFAYILILAIPGIPVFLWHLYLVSKRAERRQVGVEIVASGVLALAAPAAYWVGIGWRDPLGWWLFFLTWFQSAASIVYAYLRLKQRDLPSVPDVRTRLHMARRALLYTSFNLLVVVVLSLIEVLPTLLPIPYALQWGETLWGTFNPAIGAQPTRIGFRQLTISTLFTLLFILTWNLSS